MISARGESVFDEFMMTSYLDFKALVAYEVSKLPIRDPSVGHVTVSKGRDRWTSLKDWD